MKPIWRIETPRRIFFRPSARACIRATSLLLALLAAGMLTSCGKESRNPEMNLALKVPEVLLASPLFAAQMMHRENNPQNALTGDFVRVEASVSGEGISGSIRGASEYAIIPDSTGVGYTLVVPNEIFEVTISDIPAGSNRLVSANLYITFAPGKWVNHLLFAGSTSGVSVEGGEVSEVYVEVYCKDLTVC
ncbi:MAG: hypothetical protein OEW39_04115 [Deltaproteobacteria bacterium]|nr:hypothetical protein [Deltaproteobacteria bacterium]